MGKAPSAPDPQATIQQQTASNRETAITQANLNMIDQITPQGSLSYEQNGTWSDGTPRYKATQALSAAGQELQKTNEGTSQNLASVAQEQSGRLSGLLNTPLDFSAQKDYLEGLTSGALDKTWDRQAQNFETQLVNRGIRPGSTAYQQQMNDFSTNRSDAYNSANVNNYNTALQSQMALRSQPLNEILALSGQSQVQQPQFTSTPQTGVAGTDTAGIVNSGYQQQMQGYNANQSTLGGLFSAGASLIPMLSDRRAKSNIKRIGTAFNGLPIYAYTYNDGGPFQIGFMADEVEKVRPDAVIEGNDGLKRVLYEKAVA